MGGGGGGEKSAMMHFIIAKLYFCGGFKFTKAVHPDLGFIYSMCGKKLYLCYMFYNPLYFVKRKNSELINVVMLYMI